MRADHDANNQPDDAAHYASHLDSPLDARHQARLVALILLAVLLFCSPLLVVADRLPGVASFTLYLFGAWALVIGLAAWLIERPARH